ncbi:hypothetical protein TNCV_5138841 [Trichonephila clavipes]|nr:hypothetical protein TNCV_5138841 [Trichonephila clavipes]
MTDLETEKARVIIEYLVHIRRLEHDIQYEMLHYIKMVFGSPQRQGTTTGSVRFHFRYQMQALEASKHVNGHQNAARRTETRLKSHCANPVPSFVVQRTRVTVTLYAAL